MILSASLIGLWVGIVVGFLLADSAFFLDAAANTFFGFAVVEEKPKDKAGFEDGLLMGSD